MKREGEWEKKSNKLIDYGYFAYLNDQSKAEKYVGVYSWWNLFIGMIARRRHKCDVATMIDAEWIWIGDLHKIPIKEEKRNITSSIAKVML